MAAMFHSFAAPIDSLYAPLLRYPAYNIVYLDYRDNTECNAGVAALRGSPTTDIEPGTVHSAAWWRACD